MRLLLRQYYVSLSQYFSDKLWEEGLHISIFHSQNHLDEAIRIFTKLGKYLGVL